MPALAVKTITVELLTEPRRVPTHQLWQGDALTVVTTGYDMTGVTRAIAEIHAGGAATANDSALSTVELFAGDEELDGNASFAFTTDQMTLPVARSQAPHWMVVSLIYGSERKHTFYAANLNVHRSRANLTGVILPDPAVPASLTELENVIADLAAETIARENADDALALQISEIATGGVRRVDVTLNSGSRTLTLTEENSPAEDEIMISVLPVTDSGVFYQGQDAVDDTILNFSAAPSANSTFRLTYLKV